MVTRYPAAYPDGVMEPTDPMEQSTQVQPGPGAPTQAPAYMNYRESAKAYYPKITSCPEGWKFSSVALTGTAARRAPKKDSTSASARVRRKGGSARQILRP